MKKIMRKTIAISMGYCLTMLLIWCHPSKISANSDSIAEIPYPISYNQEEWKEMTLSEQLGSLSIPEELLQNATTELLASWILNYPLLSDVFLFEKASTAIEYFTKTSRLFDEYMNRKDAYKVMLDKYTELICSNDDANDILTMVKKQFLSMFFESNLDNQRISNIHFKTYAITPGFTSYGAISTLNGGVHYYVGMYGKYGTSALCYQYISDDFSSTVKTNMDNEIALKHPYWVKVSGATAKYNCHSYAWISQNTSENIYWLDNPAVYLESYSISFISSNGGASQNNRVVVYDNLGNITHSMVVTTSGTNPNDVLTRSKLGRYGLYIVPLSEIAMYYGSSYNVYSIIGNN